MEITDKNAIINGLKNQIHDLRTYADDGEVITLTVDQAEDIVSLLEEQEPIAPSILVSNGPDEVCSRWYLCGKCKKPIDHKDRFCKRCGQAVKWDE